MYRNQAKLIPNENELSFSQVQIFRHAVLSTIAFLFEDENLGALFMVDQPTLSMPYFHKVVVVPNFFNFLSQIIYLKIFFFQTKTLLINNLV